MYPLISKKENLNSEIIAITKISSLAYSNNIFENRFRDYKIEAGNVISSNIQTNYLDFVYEK